MIGSACEVRADWIVVTAAMPASRPHAGRADDLISGGLVQDGSRVRRAIDYGEVRTPHA